MTTTTERFVGAPTASETDRFTGVPTSTETDRFTGAPASTETDRFTGFIGPGRLLLEDGSGALLLESSGYLLLDGDAQSGGSIGSTQRFTGAPTSTTTERF